MLFTIYRCYQQTLNYAMKMKERQHVCCHHFMIIKCCTQNKWTSPCIDANINKVSENKLKITKLVCVQINVLTN